MRYTDLHVHTTYCDGKNTPEEMVLAAIEKGMKCIGFSAHSYYEKQEDWCIPVAKIPQYIAEISALKEKYKDKIEILCGVEQDYYSGYPTGSFDYAIGSVHCIEIDGDFYSVDHNVENFRILLDMFDGDAYAMSEAYYALAADVIRKTGADIIGHFDLVMKFNENGEYFDENDPRYVAAWKKAVDELLKTGKPFEINTGAVFRGSRTKPYPAPQIREYIMEHGGKFVLSGDAHEKAALSFDFDKYEQYASEEEYEKIKTGAARK